MTLQKTATAVFLHTNSVHTPYTCYNIRIIIIIIIGGRAISSIIIDGYNLIGIQHRDLQKQREVLIQQLIAYKKLKGHDIIIVFDGWKSGGHLQEQTVIGRVRVIYSRLGDKADAVIKKMVEQERKEWIVITSDREIMDHAWKHGSVPVSSDQFLEILDRNNLHDRTMTLNAPALPGNPSLAKRGEGELCDDDEEDDDMRHKGNSRQRSKKEKALMRVLRKL